MDLIEIIAETSHQANRAICEAIGEIIPTWVDLSQSERDYIMSATRYRMGNPDATAEDQHNAWMNDRIDEGWKHGHPKDEIQKTDPLIIQYKYVPLAQKIKDNVFIAIVNALKGKVFDEALQSRLDTIDEHLSVIEKQTYKPKIEEMYRALSDFFK